VPSVILGLPETEYSVTRPAVLGVVRELFTMTGIPKDTRIFYPGDINKASQPGKTGMVGDQIDNNDDVALFNQHGKVFLEVTESPDEDSPQLSDAFRMEQPYIFLDDALGIFIRPVYRQMEVRVNFRYRAEDKTAAQRWRNEMLARLDARLEVRLHSLTYNYPIPLEFLFILKELHRLRENKFGYGEDYDTYFKKHSSERLTTIVDQAGKNDLLVMPETQGRVQGWFDFPEMPEEGNREGETTNWNVGFTYTFKYSKPISARMVYPIIIHQQLLSKRYRPDPDKEYPGASERVLNNRSLSQRAIGAFESERDYWRILQQQGYAIPYFDEFIPNSVPTDTMRLMTVLSIVDPLQPRTLFNFRTDDTKVKLSELIYNFMSVEAPFMTRAYNSMFTLDLYEGYERLSWRDVKIDADLNVTSNFDLDPRKQYHVRLGLVEDLSLLSPDAVERARNNGPAAISIINVLNPNLAVNGKLPPLLGGNLIRRDDWNQLVLDLTGWMGAGSVPIRHNRCQTLTVEAYSLASR